MAKNNLSLLTPEELTEFQSLGGTAFKKSNSQAQEERRQLLEAKTYGQKEAAIGSFVVDVATGEKIGGDGKSGTYTERTGEQPMGDMSDYVLQSYGTPTTSGPTDLMAQAQAISKSLQALSDKGYGNTNLSDLPQNVDIANLPSINMPTPNFSFGNTTSATAGVKGIATGIDGQLALLDQQRQEAAKTQEESKSWLEKFMSNQDSPAEVRSDAEAQTGMQAQQFFADQKARIAEIDALNQQYNSLVAAKDAQIAQSYDAMGTTNFINNRIAQINRNAAPELQRLSAQINSKAAAMEALQGNFDRAQNYIDQAVQDASAGRKETLDAFAMFYDMNQDTLNRLDSQYKDALDRGYEIAKMQYEQDLNLRNNLAEIQLANPQVAININGTLEQAVAAVRSNPSSPDYLYKKAQIDNLYADNARLERETTGTQGYNFTATQVANGANNAGLDVVGFKSLPAEVQNFYVNSPQGVIDNLNGLVKNVELGVQDKEEAKEAIGSTSGLSPVTVSYLNGLIDMAPEPSKADNGSWWSNAWSTVKGWFN